MTPRIDIFIPTSKDFSTLWTCLESLSLQTEIHFRILLIGTQQRSHYDSLLRKFPKLKIVYKYQRGAGLVFAANQALELASGNIFIRIDDDVVVTREWLKELVNPFLQNDSIAAVTGPTLMTKKGISSRGLMSFLYTIRNSQNIFLRLLKIIVVDYLYEKKLDRVGIFMKSGNFSLGSNLKENTRGPIREVENLEACNFACKTEVLKKIGGFDRTFQKGLGDYHEADIACKMRILGFKIVFNPKALLYHHVEFGNVSPARPDAFHRMSNFIIFYNRHIGIRNADYFIRFMLNIFMQNAYYVSIFLKTRNFKQLGSIGGTFWGVYQSYKKQSV